MPSSRLANMPVKDLSVSDNGQLRPVTWYGGKGMGDVRTLSAEFLLSLQDLWRRRGDEILERVADQFPELVFSGMIKLSRVLKVEVGGPGDFARLSKQGILERLEEKGAQRRVSCSRSSCATWKSCKRSRNRRRGSCRGSLPLRTPPDGVNQ